MFCLVAPAKLNLYLRVLGCRPDGYHELETVFERIDLADELTLEPARAGLSLTCDDPSLTCGPANLILKAARLLRDATGCRQGARIRLRKRIPIAAGLGGGSSDAAATLRGLNRLWGLGLSRAALTPLATELGADVPFFLAGSACALGRGRGDVCRPLPLRRVLHHVLVVPDAQLSTREVFQGGAWRLTAAKPSSTMVLHALRNGSLSELAEGLWNDLEPEAIRRCPRISLIQSTLRRLGCLAVRVSGSGPSVYGLCRDRAQAQHIAARLRTGEAPAARRAWRVEIVRTLKTLPTTQRLGGE
jgi:4-diphosphocytidyl-2-C-methyl-D-erythritol kinase